MVQTEVTMLSLLLLCAFCAAQNPPPTMSDTFQASGEVEFHGAESTAFGKFVLARDQMKELGYERDEYEEGHGPAEVTEVILRYDMNKTYYLRGAAGHLHCIVEDRVFNGMPKFWAWLDYSTYEGATEIREVEYDTWATNVGGIRLEFGKPKTNASILYFYRRKTAESSVFYSIMDYKLVPDPALFQVPPECREKKWKKTL